MCKKKVLVVDDEPHILKAFKNFLTYENISMISATTFREAELILQNQKIDLLILNVDETTNMTDHRIKQVQRSHSELPIIAISAYPELQYKYDFKNFGFAAFLPKPIDIYYLRRVVHASLEEKPSKKLN